MVTSTFEIIKREQIVAIIRANDLKDIEKIVTSLYNGGIRVIEVTMNTPGALTAIQKINMTYKDVLVGAGTVLDAETARLAIINGAKFILAPTLREETIRMGNRYGIPVIPGVMTPTEALTAYELGAPMVKIFPVRSLGSAFGKDIKGPLPFINIMAVGGTSISNAEDYLKSGWDALGVGGSLVNQQLVDESNYEEIEDRAKKLVEARNKAKVN